MSHIGGRPPTLKPMNLDSLRDAARRALPKMVFDFIDGGAEDEVTLTRNRTAFSEMALLPRVLTDVSTVDISTEVCGIPLSMPVLIAPTGLSGVAHPSGELGGAIAATRMGTALVLSTASSYSIEEVIAETSPPWFQLYPTPGGWMTPELLERADRAGCPALVVTVDCASVGNRERDVRNGASIPPTVTPATILHLARHPRWLAGMVRGRRIVMRNLDSDANVTQAGTVARNSMRLLDPAITWKDIAAVRDTWNRPLLIKGLMDPEDAKRAIDIGADGIIVSNHGGRQLDGALASIEALPRVVDAVGDRCDVLVDGGVRRGSDVVRALALGAKACLVGRPWLYGLAWSGTDGVEAMLQILRAEIERTMRLIGRVSVDEVDSTCLALRR